MTRENRERAYKNFRLLQDSYEPKVGQSSGLFKQDVMRKKYKSMADEILKKYPDVEVKPVVLIKPKQEGKKNDKK